jgi:soluble lytic murein transglycosylase-like protein
MAGVSFLSKTGNGWVLRRFVEQKQSLRTLLAVGLLGAFAGRCMAQVIDIRPDGSTATYKGAVIASTEGVRPLFPATARTATPVTAAINNAAIRHALAQDLIGAVAWQESRMRQEAVSPKGARGVMQLMPGTAADLRVNPDDMASNIDGGAAYLARLLDRFDGDIVKTLAAYNAGPEVVERYHGVPPYPETQAYVAAVLDRLADSDGAKP